LPILSQILLPWPSYSRLCLKFRCHGNQGQSWQNLSDVIQWNDPVLGARISAIIPIQTEL